MWLLLIAAHFMTTHVVVTHAKFCSEQNWICKNHYSDVKLGAMTSQTISLTILYSTVCSGADQRKIKPPHHWPLCGEFTGDILHLQLHITLYTSSHRQTGKRACIIEMTWSYLIGLTLLLLRAWYSRWIKSIPWLLMPWLLPAPGHQQPWYWQNGNHWSLFWMGIIFVYLCWEMIEKWFMNKKIIKTTLCLGTTNSKIYRMIVWYNYI